MGLSEYYNQKSHEELIQEWEWAIDPDPGYAFDYDTAPVWLPVRDAIHSMGLDNNPKVIKLDKQAIINAIKYKAEMPHERDYEDLERWWWHLEKDCRWNLSRGAFTRST